MPNSALENTAWRTIGYQCMLFMIALTVSCYGITPQIGGITLRPEKFFMITALMISAAFVLMRGGKMKFSRAESILGSWLLLSVLVSLISANPPAAIKHTIDLFLAMAIFFLFSTWQGERLLLRSPSGLLTVGMLLGCGSILVALALVTGMIHFFPFLEEFVMREYGPSGLVRIRMTMWEANLFGALMMMFSLVSIAEFKRNRLWSWFCLLTSHVGMLVAYSRGPLAGYFFGLLWYCHLLGFRRMRRFSVVILLAIILASGVQLIRTSSGEVDESSAMRFSTLMVRVVTVQKSFEDIAAAPILGNGTYSSDFLHVGDIPMFGESEDAKGWISVLPIAILHDTGVIGFILFHGFLLFIFRNGANGVRQVQLQKVGIDPLVPRRMAAWLASALGMLMLSISTSAYSLALFWLVMAVVASIPRALGRLQQSVPITASQIKGASV